MPMSRRRRLAWFAAAAFVAVFGLGEFGRWVIEAWQGRSWWGIDLRLVLDAGSRLAAGRPLYDDPKFLYPPLAAVVGRAISGIGFDVASLAFAGLKVAIAVACVSAVTPGWSRPARAVALAAVVGSLPFVHDVMLGNVNVLLVGAMVPAVLGSPRPRHGVLLGLAVAGFAKPLAVPILIWLLVWRRPVFFASVVAAGAATLLGVALAGPAAHVEWLGALVAGTRFAAPFEGNHGVTALAPGLWLPVAVVTAVGLVLVLARRGPTVGLVWATASGLLLAPYAGTYAALPIALALPRLVVLAPGLALAAVAASPIATTHPLPLYAAAILLASLATREPRPGGAPAREEAVAVAPVPAARTG